MKRIQDEAYKYALKTMKNYTQTAREVIVTLALILFFTKSTFSENRGSTDSIMKIKTRHLLSIMTNNFNHRFYVM